MENRLVNLDKIRDIKGVSKKVFETIEKNIEVVQDEVENVLSEFNITIPRTILEFMHKDWYAYLKEKYNVDRIWSYSRISTYDENSTYEYYLRYIKHIPNERTGVYLVLGSALHDCLERYYIKGWTIEEFKEEWRKSLSLIDTMGLKFHYTDEEANEKRQKKYVDCLSNYGEHFTQCNGDMIPELPIELVLDVDGIDEIFVGFIDRVDFTYKDNKLYAKIVDYKSSTIFAGKALIKKSAQLTLYARAIMDMYNIPIEQVSIGFDFLKYVKVSYRQGNGKIKETYVERNNIVGKLAKDIMKRLQKELEYDITEANDVINLCYATNDFSGLPIELQDIYTIKKGIRDVPLTQEHMDTVFKHIKKVIIEIKGKEKLYYENGEDDMIWDEEITDAQSFYFSTLCTYTVKNHIPYRRYLEDKELFLNNENKSKSLQDNLENNKKEDEDILGLGMDLNDLKEVKPIIDNSDLKSIDVDIDDILNELDNL